ncbi:hypothetical protein [Ferrimonas senticii]|uniref:hypothetical protein n=1 Tax=Ferrimonas senticii TaxID=394566 RepID=UPI0012EC1252|nr:hypothetical protein [Ferrimonas senticii]
MNRKLIAITASVLLTGCASAPLTLSYSPSSMLSVEGNAKVGDFKYLPGLYDQDVKPNQIKNTALGNIIFEKNIDEYFEKAVFTESRFVGINIADSGSVISGNINQFLIDDLGYQIDWTLDVSYLVKGTDKSECYSKNQVIRKSSEKFGNVFGALNDVMRLNIEKAFSDPDFVKCINSQ